jgi:hypothetical protein
MSECQKSCSQCQQVKRYDQFSVRRRAKDGRSSTCKQCIRESDAAYRDRFKDKLLRQKRDAYQADPAKFKARVKVHQQDNAALFNARNAVRYARKKKAVPEWADLQDIASFYETSIAVGMLTGEWHEVDHIVPLNSKLVCGLHCPANLRVIPATQNQSKGNRYWPDMP